ncbi:hypothetical protein FACS189445_3090 [Spirochaetia bacterium]|nr:hypothetical protein FACS189445_3090 [Spirochaetia bacterium]
MFMKQIIETLIERAAAKDRKIVAGFDGFIDTIAKVLRHSGGEGEGPRYFETIEEFGAYIAGHAHKSGSIELDIIERRMGGNMPLFARAIATLMGADHSGGLTCVGMFSDAAGAPEPLFNSLPGKHISYAPAATATALEFTDGKIFLFPRFVLNEPPRIEAVSELVRGADLIAFCNWGELSFASALWRSFFEAAAAEKQSRSGGSFGETSSGPCFFFDLADFSRRTDREIEEVLLLMRDFSSLGHTILSLNRNEALLLEERILLQKGTGMDISAAALQKRYGIEDVIVHSHNDVHLCAGGILYRVAVTPITAPKISTGAGDHFNAAFAHAFLLGLAPEEQLRFAAFYASAYITQGTSPCMEDLRLPQ